MRIGLFLGCLLPLMLAAQPFTGGFSFALPWDDSTTQAFLPVFTAQAIGPADTVRIGSSGHFEASGQPIRFWGVNITAAAAFPPPALAPRIAGRLRKMGVNLVRFHHLDNPWTGSGGTIFLNQGSQGTRTLDPLTLDRLMAFIAALKAEGIYVNMNLHVSRTFRAADGVVAADSLVEFGKMVNLYDPWLIFLQQEYAQQLLGHVNPYTGLALRDDPVLAMVEITNENSLFAFWKGDALQPLARGGQLPQVYSDQLDSRWQAWLAQRYGSDAALAAAWNQGLLPPGQDEQLVNRDFETGSPSPWQLELHSGAQASLSLDPVQPFAGQASGRVQVQTVTGTAWHLQFKQAGFDLAADSTYVLRFAARADAPRSLSISFMRDNAPYTWYGGTTLTLSPTWQVYQVYFTAPETNQGQGRLSFSFDDQPGSYWFDAFSLARPAVAGLGNGESLTAGTVARIPFSQRLGYTPARVADEAAFYLDVQRAYFGQMAAFLRDSLGLRVPLTGTNALSGPADLVHQAGLDFIDDHSYWDHPWFPNVAWDPRDWLIQNTSLLRQPDLGALTGVLGGVAQAGRPYTLSEYNHPFPNRYQTEMMPLLTAYASLHDADGLMFFEYNGDNTAWTVDHIGGYFALHRNPVLMALSPACAYAYRRGLVQRDPQPLQLTYGEDWLAQQARSLPEGRWTRTLPYDSRLSLRHGMRSVLVAGDSAPALPALPPAGGSPYQAATGEIAVSTAAGLLRVASPAYVAVSGFLADTGQVAAGPLTLVSGSDFGTLVWVRPDGDSLHRAGPSLLTIAARAQNTGMGWIGTQSLGDQWGTAPTQVQPLRLRLDLRLRADSLRLCRLDVRGAPLGCTWVWPQADGVYRLDLDQAQDQTLWYGLEAVGDGSTLSLASPLTLADWAVFPSPAQDRLTWRYTLDQPAPVWLELYDLQGRRVRHLAAGLQSPGTYTYEMSLTGLAAGAYRALWRSEQGQASRLIVLQ